MTEEVNKSAGSSQGADLAKKLTVASSAGIFIFGIVMAILGAILPSFLLFSSWIKPGPATFSFL